MVSEFVSLFHRPPQLPLFLASFTKTYRIYCRFPQAEEHSSSQLSLIFFTRGLTTHWVAVNEAGPPGPGLTRVIPDNHDFPY